MLAHTISANIRVLLKTKFLNKAARVKMRHRCLRFLQSRPRIDETNLIKKKCDIDAADSSYRSHEFTNPANRNRGKNQVVRNIIVEIIDSGFEHFIIFEYVYDIQPLGKCFLNTSINESCQEGW